MLKLTDLVELVMLETGEFIVETLQNVNLDLPKFWLMTKRILLTYEQYKPLTFAQNIHLTSPKFQFSEDMEHGIPDWISEVVPVNVTNMMDIFYYSSLHRLYQQGMTETLEFPRPFIFKYDRPNLHVTERGIMEVTGQYAHEYEEIHEAEQGLVEVGLKTLTLRDRLFIDLVSSRFLMSVGRSRRAFTLNELPIAMDADMLVSEGQDRWDRAMEELQQTSKWYEALGQ
jgi:hypothetical protein